tara:strand:+ start:379 stop:693 length:315 start_codon:yes stop_codon:yes gene_type:complete
MKKTILTLGLLCTLLNACAYKPIIDTAGRSSASFNESQAKEITNDIMICKNLAKQHTNSLVESYKVVHNWYLRPSVLWLMPKAEYTNKKLVKNCLEGRGHNVIN